MKQRTLKELYKILLDNFKNNTENFYICNTIDNIYKESLITNEEWIKLQNHFKKQFPNQNLYPEIYNCPLFTNNKQIWFTRRALAIFESNLVLKEIRIRLITLIIDRLESPKV